MSAETVSVRPTATDEALINPDMGFVYYKYSNRLWAYGINTPENDTLDWFPGCSTIYYRLKFADTYYGEMTHYGLYRLAWADVRRRT